jgi:hypothetical protein
MSGQKLSTHDELLKLQSEAFQYFLDETNPKNGLVKDKTAENWPSSITATGFALASYPIAVERGFMSRNLAIERTLATLRFFWNSPQGNEANVTGYKGFYYHFLDMHTGRRVWNCELSTIDSAFLIAGMLTAGLYFVGDTKDEHEIRKLSDALYRRVDWQWAAQNQGEAVTQAWTPERGFEDFRWEGYDEGLLLYMLALGSPTHPISEASYKAWTASYQWENIYGYEYLYGGPLFVHQLSHMWIDFRNIQDAIMGEKGIDYFENSRRATYIQQEYAMRNPQQFVGYNATCWGVTASDGPGMKILTVNNIEHQFYGYLARGVPNGPDDGTIAPWAALASLPFAPEIVLPTLDHYMYMGLKQHRYGFKSSFNQTYPAKGRYGYWIGPYHFGLNLGPIIIMTENYRTEFLWSLMKKCPYLVNGLRRAGFAGGWLG